MIRAGSSKATNNDDAFLKLKIDLRIDLLKNIEKPKILDCFAGDSVLWKTVEKKTRIQFERITIDADERYKTDYTMDALKYIQKNELNDFNIIDLDTWGSPVKYIDALIKKKYKGFVVCTYCSPVSLTPDKILALNYYGEIYNTIKKKSLLCKDIGLLFRQWILSKGVTEIKGITTKKKIYCSFEIK